MKRKHWILILIVAFIIPVILAGCSSSDDENVVVRVGEVTRSIFYAPQYIAITEGFFEEEGLKVELQTTPGGDTTMTALLSNGIDVALVGSETSIYVYQQGSEDPVINFAQLTQTDGTFLVAREADPDFAWEKLAGSVFLGQRVGGMPQMAGEFVLKKHGIEPHEDLELIQNVDFANIPSAFASGTGQYVQLFEPQASIFEMEGRGHVLASFGVESGHLPYTVFMSKQSFIEDNGETIQKFTNAVYKAQQWVQSVSSERAAQAVMPFFPDTDEELIIRVIERYKEQDSYAMTPAVTEDQWNNLLDIMEEAGELSSRIDYNTLVDNSFAEHAVNP